MMILEDSLTHSHMGSWERELGGGGGGEGG